MFLSELMLISGIKLIAFVKSKIIQKISANTKFGQSNSSLSAIQYQLKIQLDFAGFHYHHIS